MMYKKKVQELLDVLEGKLRIIENTATGQMRLTNQEILNHINQTKQIREKLAELVNIEREGQ
jgi:putative sterol carrier protein